MIIKIKDTDIQYLKDLCKYFNQVTAYVHEGVHITVDPFAGVEIHEAADSLIKFRDKCIFPETMDMLAEIFDQLNDPAPDAMDLKTVLSSTIHEWFYMKQEKLGIKDGAEPLDTDIHTLEEKLVKECERVLEWQRDFKSVAVDNNKPLGRFYTIFNDACCTCSGNIVTSYDMDQHNGDEPVEGLFEAWDSMVQAIKDNGRDSVLYCGHKLHNLINSIDPRIYDYGHGIWIDVFIDWYLKEVQ